MIGRTVCHRRVEEKLGAGGREVVWRTKAWAATPPWSYTEEAR